MKPLPVIRVVQAPNSAFGAAADASVAGLGAVFGAFSAAVDLIRQEKMDLQIFLHNRMIPTVQADKRQGNIFGRLYNRLTGENPDYVELSGVQLGQVYEVNGDAIPEQIGPDGQYLLRRDRVEAALNVLRNELGEVPK